MGYGIKVKNLIDDLKPIASVLGGERIDLSAVEDRIGEKIITIHFNRFGGYYGIRNKSKETR